MIFAILCFGGIFASMVRGKLRADNTKMGSNEEKNLYSLPWRDAILVSLYPCSTQ